MEIEYSEALLAVAAERANKPGAIFVGDLNQLVGPAPTEGEGDADGKRALVCPGESPVCLRVRLLQVGHREGKLRKSHPANQLW